MVALYRADFPAGSLGLELGPSTCDEVLSRPDVFAAIPAPAYAEGGPHLLMRDVRRQIQVATRNPNRGVSFCVEGSITVARRGGNPTRGCVAAVQSLEPLLEAGAIVVPEANDYTARTAIVLRRDGGLSFVASRGSTANELAREIVDSTDGSWAAVTSVGGSAVLATRQGVLLGDPDAVADAWIVARMPVVSPSRFVAQAALPDVGAAPVPSERERLRSRVVHDDTLQIMFGIALLAGAAKWYLDDHR